jgi:hypothetical protein
LEFCSMINPLISFCEKRKSGNNNIRYIVDFIVV